VCGLLPLLFIFLWAFGQIKLHTPLDSVGSRTSRAGHF